MALQRPWGSVPIASCGQWLNLFAATIAVTQAHKQRSQFKIHKQENTASSDRVSNEINTIYSNVVFNCQTQLSLIVAFDLSSKTCLDHLGPLTVSELKITQLPLYCVFDFLGTTLSAKE